MEFCGVMRVFGLLQYKLHKRSSARCSRVDCPLTRQNKGPFSCLLRILISESAFDIKIYHLIYTSC